MSFWKLTKALAVAPTDGINGILEPLTALDETAPETDSVAPDDVAAHHKALDELLLEPDLLSEIKSGGNQRLTDFLARKEVVLRLGGWVVWGLGRGFLDEKDDTGSMKEGARSDALGSGLLPDELESGKVPDEVLQAAERSRRGMGGVPRRRDVDEAGKFTEGDPDDETEEEKRWSRCVERFLAFCPLLYRRMSVSWAGSINVLAS